jgi:hypothetical protein
MAKIDKVLGSISPLYGIASGQGLYGKTSPLAMLIHSDKKKEKKPGEAPEAGEGMKRGGKVKKMAKGGSTASKRADGCAQRGKTRGRFV